MAWATSSLPVPLSPSIRTVLLLSATRGRIVKSCIDAGVLGDDVPERMLPGQRFLELLDSRDHGPGSFHPADDSSIGLREQVVLTLIGDALLVGPKS